MKLKTTPTFKKDYDRLPKNIQKKVKRILNLLKENLRHPSIRAKKITDAKDIWAGRINRFYRFSFKIQENKIILRHVGPHNQTLKSA